MLSFGGVAVQRQKREQAIRALGAAVASAGQGTLPLKKDDHDHHDYHKNYHNHHDYHHHNYNH